MISSEPLSKHDLRKFGLSTGLIFIILFGLLFPWFLDSAFPLWPWIIAIVLCATALLSPSKLRGVHHYWMMIGTKLGWINSRIILGSVFFLLFTPLGVIMSLFGYDPLKRKLNSKEQTYRILKEKNPAERMEHPY